MTDRSKASDEEARAWTIRFLGRHFHDTYHAMQAATEDQIKQTTAHAKHRADRMGKTDD